MLRCCLCWSGLSFFSSPSSTKFSALVIIDDWNFFFLVNHFWSTLNIFLGSRPLQMIETAILLHFNHTYQRTTCVLFLSLRDMSEHQNCCTKRTFFSTLDLLLSAEVQEPELGAVPHWAPWLSKLGGMVMYRISGSFFSPTNLGRGRSVVTNRLPPVGLIKLFELNWIILDWFCLKVFNECKDIFYSNQELPVWRPLTQLRLDKELIRMSIFILRCGGELLQHTEVNLKLILLILLWAIIMCCARNRFSLRRGCALL